MSAALPRITVVTPSFNQAQFLETTMLSVLGQCYPNLEYIVMDGGSTDGSVAILERHAASLAYWTSAPDRGQSDAINRGFERATGDILCWLNSDDFLFPGALHRVARELAGSVHAPALMYGSCLFFRDGEATAKVVLAKPHDPARLRMTHYIIQPSAFWTRALWQATGPLDQSLSYAFDWDWFLRASAHAAFTPCAEILSAYRFHAAHKSGGGGEKRRAEILAVVRRHGTPAQLACYEFATRRWPDVERYFARLFRLESARIPGAAALARAGAPSLWSLPAGITMSDLRVCRGMLAEA